MNLIFPKSKFNTRQYSITEMCADDINNYVTCYYNCHKCGCRGKIQICREDIASSGSTPILELFIKKIDNKHVCFSVDYLRGLREKYR